MKKTLIISIIFALALVVALFAYNSAAAQGYDGYSAYDSYGTGGYGGFDSYGYDSYGCGFDCGVSYSSYNSYGCGSSCFGGGWGGFGGVGIGYNFFSSPPFFPPP